MCVDFDVRDKRKMTLSQKEAKLWIMDSFTVELQIIDEQVMQCNISPNLMKKQTHLHLGRAEGECFFSTFSFLGELFL